LANRLSCASSPPTKDNKNEDSKKFRDNVAIIMMAPHRYLLSLYQYCWALTGGAVAEAQKIGTATRILTAVNGDYGSVEVREPVHKDENIRTSKSGLGEFVFADGTRFAVGAGSSVKLDKFVYDDSQSVQKLSIRAAKGTFRWISGRSKSSAYEIKTPVGTIGIRGTKFDFYVGADGTTAIVLLGGAVRFCGTGGCVQLRRKCDCVIAKPRQRPTVTRASRRTLTTLGNARALPFLTGTQTLSGGFGASTGCGMSMAAATEPGRNNQQRSAPDRSAPNREAPARSNSPARSAPDRSAPNTEAPAPNRPDAPAPNRPDAPTPNNPDPPGTPEATKRGHGYGDENHTHAHDPQGKAKGQGRGRGNER
jgi:hypothetical protein